MEDEELQTLFGPVETKVQAQTNTMSGATKESQKAKYRTLPISSGEFDRGFRFAAEAIIFFQTGGASHYVIEKELQFGRGKNRELP